MIFGNYKRLVYLAQTDDPDLAERARKAADYLDVEFEQRRTGYGELLPSLQRFVRWLSSPSSGGATSRLRSRPRRDAHPRARS